MATASDIVTRALTKIGVATAEAPITSAELADGIDLLNDMLSEWEEAGPQLGFTPVSSGAEEVRVPRGSVGCVKANLAVRAAPEYTKMVSIELATEARESYKAMLIANQPPLDVAFPATLPRGSGNEDDDFNDDRFYPDAKEVNF